MVEIGAQPAVVPTGVMLSMLEAEDVLREKFEVKKSFKCGTGMNSLSKGFVATRQLFLHKKNAEKG